MRLLIHVADVPGRHELGTGEINYINIYRKKAELHHKRHDCDGSFIRTGDVVAKGLRRYRAEAIQAMQEIQSRR